MNLRNKFWWFAGISLIITSIIFTTIAIFFWNSLLPAEKILFVSLVKSHFGYIFIALFLLLAGIAFILDAVFHNYILSIHRLAEETILIHSVNPSHRIRPEGSDVIVRMAEIINEGADRYEELQKDVQQKILYAKAEVEEEKNILASFLSELSEGVLICNTEGQILFYNKQAKELLEGEKNKENRTSPASQQPIISVSQKFIGLGRSVFGIIDKNLILHAMDEMVNKLKHSQENLGSHFVIVGREEHLLKVEAVPILNTLKQFSGFILIINDITRQLHTEKKMDYFLQSLLQRTRASLAGIRSAIEAIREYPDMGADKLNLLSDVIHKESVNLSDFINKISAEYSNHIKTQWPLTQMHAGDLFETVRKKAMDNLGITALVEKCDEESFVRVESYSIIMAMLFVMNQIKESIGCKRFICKIEKKERFVNVDLIWKGKPIRIESLKKWDEQPLMLGDEGIPMTLKEVIAHHEAEIWCHSCREGKDQSYFRFFLPAVPETTEPDRLARTLIRSSAITPDSSPGFYDFDLFNQPGQNSELDNCLLSNLTYTIFDTETTGLNPNEDEIISIGALRMVNGRLLREEIFDQLIDPKLSLSPESVNIHGIQPEMLKNQPTIDMVLPLFHSFAKGTILVGHNTSFDMRMFQLKEAETGVRFINPVLDTLMLSAVIHPAHENHSIEEISRRLGVRVVGRHTALGDAITTGEIFLKLIPLLNKSGIYTLKEARLASQKTYYARLKY